MVTREEHERVVRVQVFQELPDAVVDPRQSSRKKMSESALLAVFTS